MRRRSDGSGYGGNSAARELGQFAPVQQRPRVWSPLSLNPAAARTWHGAMAVQHHNSGICVPRKSCNHISIITCTIQIRDGGNLAKFARSAATQRKVDSLVIPNGGENLAAGDGSATSQLWSLSPSKVLQLHIFGLYWFQLLKVMN